MLSSVYSSINYPATTLLFHNWENDLMRINQKDLHSKEIDVQKMLGQEALQFDLNDLKPKLLYLMAEFDDANAFPINSPYLTIEKFISRISPESDTNEYISNLIKLLNKHQKKAQHGDRKSIEYLKAFEVSINESNKGVGRILESLHEKFDIRFKIVSTTKEICAEISAASKINNLKSLIFTAHGMPNDLMISDNELVIQDPKNHEVLFSTNYINVDETHLVNNILYKINENCFSGLPNDTTISLLACNTGESPTAIASTISKLSKLDVWAPRNSITIEQTDLSTNIPPIPTFWNPDKFENSFFDDHTCKFSPNGLSKCGALNTKILPLFLDYTPPIILSLAAIYCVKKYFWNCRNIAKF
ncbi:MAG: hypothetical protein H0X29_06925 [Parachlamydiaceae bacterium]|nr:hypothetical protein [Parachlamydiaceae bacterium]